MKHIIPFLIGAVLLGGIPSCASRMEPNDRALHQKRKSQHRKNKNRIAKQRRNNPEMF